MKQLIVYVPVLLFCVFTVQLKAEENEVVSSDTPVLTDIQVIDQDPNLSSSLVWDKNKSTKKEKKKKSDFGKQMWKNANFGWNTYKTDDYKWRNIFIGTGYGRDFENAKDAYWQVGLNLNWSKYTLYPEGKFNFTDNKDYLKTTSFSVPAIAGYNIYKSKLRSVVLKAYTGPVFEFIVNSKVNGYTQNLHPTNNFQTGWTVGANLLFLYLLSARVAYTYYPYSLFQKDDLYRRALSFSLGF